MDVSNGAGEKTCVLLGKCSSIKYKRKTTQVCLRGYLEDSMYTLMKWKGHKQ